MRHLIQDKIFIRRINLLAFPTIGDTRFFYIDDTTKKQYYWDGSAYVEMFVSGGGSSSSNPPQSFKIQNTATSTLLWCPTAGNTSAIPTSSSLQAFYPWMSPFQLQEDLIINELSTEVVSGVTGLSFMMGIYELDSNFNCQTLIVGTSVLSGVTGGLKTYTIGSPITLDKNKWYGSVILGNVNFNHRACIAPNIIGGSPTSAVNLARFRMNYYAFPAVMPASLNIDIASGFTYAVSIWVK